MKFVKILLSTFLIACFVCFHAQATTIDNNFQEKFCALIDDIVQARLLGRSYQNILCSGWQSQDVAWLSERVAYGANMDHTEVSSSDIDLIQLFDQAEKSERGRVIFLKNAHEYLRPIDYDQILQKAKFYNAFLLLTFGPSKKVIFILHVDNYNELDEAVISRASKIIE